LQEMVLEDVADRAGLLVVLRTAFDPDRLGNRDLHVVDELTVPDRLEDSVCKPQRQHVLHGLLAEGVIDAEELALVEVLLVHGVQLARRREVVAERLLDDQAPPPTPPWKKPIDGQPRLVAATLPDSPYDHLEDRRRDREVIDTVAFGPALLVELLQRLREAIQAGRIREVGRHVADS